MRLNKLIERERERERVCFGLAVMISLVAEKMFENLKLRFL